MLAKLVGNKALFKTLPSTTHNEFDLPKNSKSGKLVLMHSSKKDCGKKDEGESLCEAG